MEARLECLDVRHLQDSLLRLVRGGQKTRGCECKPLYVTAKKSSGHR